MGRIKTALIKRATREIMEKNGDKFTDKFEENRNTLKSTVSLPSKKMRNIIAGYTTRLVKMKDKQPAQRRSMSSKDKYMDYDGQ